VQSDRCPFRQVLLYIITNMSSLLATECSWPETAQVNMPGRIPYLEFEGAPRSNTVRIFGFVVLKRTVMNMSGTAVKYSCRTRRI
jgi:hypothetical protein